MKNIYIMFVVSLMLTLSNATEIPNIPENLSAISHSVAWDYKEKSGEYRLVVISKGWEHVHSEVYIQWIASDGDKGVLTTVSTVPIKEINEDAIWSAGIPILDFENEEAIFTISMDHTYMDENKSIVIIPSNEPGKYKTKETSTTENNRSDEILSTAHSSAYKLLEGDNEICHVVLKDINARYSDQDIEKNDNKDTNPIPDKQVKGELSLPDDLILDKPMVLDFDNDGVEDRIFMYSDSSRYIDGDIFYVAYGDKKEKIDRKEKLTVEDVMVFPCQFDMSVKSASSCPTFSQDADEAGINVLSKEKHNLLFRGRYTNMLDWKYKGNTYLELESSRGDKKFPMALIRPHNKREFDTICIFEPLSLF